jgi:O-antigen/teichoic acid export membrane protein
MVLLAFHAAMGPVYPVLARQNKVAALEDAYGTAVRWMAIVLLPVGVVLAWNRNDLLALAGPEFVTGGNALVILAIGYSICTCFGTVAYLLMLSGHKSVETWNAAFAAVLNLVLAIVLVPRFGLAGAAFATASSFVLLNVLRVAEARYVVGLRTFRPYFIRIVAVSATGGVSVFVMLQSLGILQGSDGISVAIRIALMLVMHAGILWTVGLNRQDKDMLWALVPSVTGRTVQRP